MTMSQGSTRTTHAPHRTRLRLALTAATPGSEEHLDGGWWPQSRDLAIELADLVDHFPPARGRIVRALVSPPDWEPSARRIPIAHGYVKVGSFPRDDTHHIDVTLSDRRVLRVLVVPPGFTEDQGEEALLAASARGNAHSASDVLVEVTNHPAVDPMGHWTDDGGRP